jgi:hypothetical protein
MTSGGHSTGSRPLADGLVHVLGEEAGAGAAVLLRAVKRKVGVGEGFLIA